MTNIQTTTIARIIDALNAERAIDNGLSHGDAKLRDDELVAFTYPVPVVGGACIGTIEVYADGRLFDDTSDQEFDTLDMWLADLNAMMEI